MRLLSFDCIETKMFIFLFFFGFYYFLECSVLHEGTKPEKYKRQKVFLKKDKTKDGNYIAEVWGFGVYTI